MFLMYVHRASIGSVELRARGSESADAMISIHTTVSLAHLRSSSIVYCISICIVANALNIYSFNSKERNDCEVTTSDIK
jgi:hypothetical protein